tara:strand:- start:385 stop:924 length:540 start_codon:yes stop_codon:yes gene_type:complete
MAFPTKARTTNMIRRQSFTGKTLSFIEVIFNQNYSGSATTPESDGSTFQTVTNVINSSAGNGATLLACNYYLGRKATSEDAQINTAVTAGNSIDVYQYIVEGGPEIFDAPASAGASTGEDSTVKSGAEADIETAILAAISDDSAGTIGVKVSRLSADGEDTLAGGNPEVIGMFDGRGEA